MQTRSHDLYKKLRNVLLKNFGPSIQKIFMFRLGWIFAYKGVTPQCIIYVIIHNTKLMITMELILEEVLEKK